MKVKANLVVRVQTKQFNAETGKLVSESPIQTNLVMDGGLNALARSTNATYPAEATGCCRVGSGSTSDKIASGAITFTQAGTTLTASAGFFTAGMVGMLFKWGTGSGGNEIYITAYTSATQVTVGTSATVAVPEVGVVWNVIRTTLETLLYSSSTYENISGSNGTTITGAAVTHKRTYNFPVQVAPYNVNEVGYFRANTGTTIFGRVVLSATEVVAPTNFLQVVIEFDVTYSPGSPTANGNVGTNIDTSGNTTFEIINTAMIGVIGTNGAVQSIASNGCSIDGSNTTCVFGRVATWTQNPTTNSSNYTWGSNATTERVPFAVGISWAFATNRGQMNVVANTTISTTGQTLYGIGVCDFNSGQPRPALSVKFTNTYAMPTGSFLPVCTFAVTYNRNLVN